MLFKGIFLIHVQKQHFHNFVNANAYNSEFVFDVGDASKKMEIEVLYDNEREIRESFMLIMDPDENLFASLDV